MICRKCQGAKEQGKRCGECHKRRCKAWHQRFVKAGVAKTAAGTATPEPTAFRPAVKPKTTISAAEQKRLLKNQRERERRARIAAARK